MDPALKKKLESLLKIPDNQKCADCKKRGPRWASANLGIFVCIECSGIHRNLGVHISFVRSVNLDTWTKAQVDVMEEWGNRRANLYYEANIPPNVYRPKEGDSVKIVEKFIRDKYEYKRYISKTIPPKDAIEAVSEEINSNNDTKKTRKPVMAQYISSPEPAASKTTLVPVRQVIETSLIDFMDDPISPAPSQAAPVYSSASNQFGSFDAPPQAQAPPVPTTTGFDFNSTVPYPSQAPPAVPISTPQQVPGAEIWSNFESSPAAHVSESQGQSQVVAAPKPMASMEAILSLYNAPPVPSFPPAYGGVQGYGNSVPPALHSQPGIGPRPIPGMYPGQLQPGMQMQIPMGHGQGASSNYGVHFTNIPQAPITMYQPVLSQPGYGIPSTYSQPQQQFGGLPQQYSSQYTQAPPQPQQFQPGQVPIPGYPYGQQTPPVPQQATPGYPAYGYAPR